MPGLLPKAQCKQNSVQSECTFHIGLNRRWVEHKTGNLVSVSYLSFYKQFLFPSSSVTLRLKVRFKPLRLLIKTLPNVTQTIYLALLWRWFWLFCDRFRCFRHLLLQILAPIGSISLELFRSFHLENQKRKSVNYSFEVSQDRNMFPYDSQEHRTIL